MDTVLIHNQIRIPELRIDSISIKNDSIAYKLEELIGSNKEALDSISMAINKSFQEDRIINWVSNDTVFTVLITLLVFILGILINRAYKWFEKSREQYKLKTYFKYHLDEITDNYCDNLKNGYRDFYQKKGMNTGIPLSPPKLLSNDFERIGKIDSKDLFEIISDSKSFSKLLSEFDFLDKLSDEVFYYHSIAYQNSTKLNQELSDLSNEYLDKLAEYVEYERRNNPNFETDRVWKFINDCIVKFYSEFARKRELKRFYREIIRPVQELLVDTDLFRTHLVAKEITRYGKRLSYKYNEYKKFMTELRLQYRTFYNYVKGSQERLKLNRNKINWR